MSTILPLIMQFIQTYVLPPVGIAATALLGLWLSRLEAREQVKVMQTNSKLAVQAVEQIAANQPPEVKAAMALKIAQQLNQQAKINVPDATVTPVNEAHVLTLPATNAPVPSSWESLNTPPQVMPLSNISTPPIGESGTLPKG